MRRSPSLPALLAPLVFAACARKPAGVAVPSFKDAPVVLVSVDTLRADHLPAYGYRGVATPALDALRADGVLFTNAWSHAPLTLPSHATVMTGLLPAANGLRDNIGYRLAPAATTLAERLKTAGYATGGAVSSIVLSGASGISRGFDFFDDRIDPTSSFQPVSRVQRAGGVAVDRLKEWLWQQTGPRIFAFLHLYEPHSPYEPPEPFKSRYAEPYDGEIAAADALVGRFVEALKARGLYDDALLVFFSDHGEGLGDHGESEHGVFLYREVLHVPLLVKLPKRAFAGATVSGLVELRDVYATACAAAGLKDVAPPEGTVSLVRLAAGEPAPERRVLSETLFPRIHFGWSELFSLTDARFRYVDAPRPELYDLEKDPGERTSLIGEKPDALRRLRAEMERVKPGFRPPAAVDPDQAKKLASLGYLSAGVPDSSGPRPDPKDEIATVQKMKEGLKHFMEGRPDAALAVFDPLLKENPRMLDVWEIRSQALAQLGRMEESLESLKKAAELSPPGSTTHIASVANRCLQMGRADEAIRNALVAKELGDASADEILARAFLAKGDLASAEASAKASLAAPRNRDRGLLVLAKVAEERGDLAGALALADRFLAERGKDDAVDAGVHFLKGDVLARLGRNAEAEGELKEETRLFPTNPNGWSSLIALYASLDRRAEARETARAMVAARPLPDAYLNASRALAVVGERAASEALRREGLARFPGDARLR